MAILLLLVRVGTPRRIFDHKSQMLSIKGINILKIKEKDLAPNMLLWQQKIYIFVFSLSSFVSVPNFTRF